MPAKKTTRRNWRRNYFESRDIRIAELERELKAERTESYYWRTEAMTLRSDLIAQLRESAKNKPWPAEDQG